MSTTALYADDTTIYDCQTDLVVLNSNFPAALESLKKWCEQNGMWLNTKVNHNKTETNVFLITDIQ